MGFDRVLLVNPSIRAFYGALRPPAGLGYLAQALANKGIEYDVLDMQLGYKFKDLQKRIDLFGPSVIGITMFSYMYKATYDLIRQVRSHNPNITIVVGGPHVSTVREAVLAQCPEIDLGMVRESDETLIELCQGRKLEDIKGVLYRDNNGLVYSSDRPLITDLDSLSLPLYEKFELGKYIPEKVIISSRGCPYNCIYCAVGAVAGRKLRFRSAGNVVDEIEHWYGKGYRQFVFMDDNFTFDKDRVYKICNEIEGRRLKKLLLRCAGVRADRVDRMLLERMKEVGFKHLSFGVEGGNSKILRVLRKGETIGTITRAIGDACELGFDVNLFFLAGSPYETRADIEDSVKIALGYPILRVNFYNIIPYPRTQLYDWLLERGYLLRPPEQYLNDVSTNSNTPIFITPELSFKDRTEVLVYLKKIEKKVLMKAIQHRLRKYRVPVLAAKTIAYMLTRRIAEKLIFENRLVRKVVEKARLIYHTRN